MKSFALIAFALAAFGLLSASTACAQQTHGEYYDYVTKVNVGDGGYLAINVAGGLANPEHCQNPWFTRSANTLSDDQTKAWLQIALASFLSKKKVYVESSGCTPYGHLILTKLQLEQQ